MNDQKGRAYSNSELCEEWQYRPGKGPRPSQVIRLGTAVVFNKRGAESEYRHTALLVDSDHLHCLIQAFICKTYLL